MTRLGHGALITGVSPSGSPAANVETMARSILDADRLGAIQAASNPVLPASAYLPTAPAVMHAACFRILAQTTFISSEVAARLMQDGLTAAEFDGLGWQDGASVAFTCDAPPPGQASERFIVVHRFAHPRLAWQALSAFADYTPNPNESRECGAPGSLVVCVTGIAPSGSALADVELVMQQVLAGAQ